MTKQDITFAEYLEKSRSLRTLMCLLESEDKGLDQLLKEIGGSKTTGMSRIDELVRLSLVVKKASPTEKRKMMYCLTSEGRAIAIQLKGVLEHSNIGKPSVENERTQQFKKARATS